MNLYFECNSGISGDMSVAALLDLGANREKLCEALNSLNLKDEFSYTISEVKINSIRATDFDVKLKHQEHDHNHNNHHHHRNLNDVISVIDGANATFEAKELAKKIFSIVANAESKVHGVSIDEVHFHEVGAIDSIADILGFAVLFDDLKVEKVFFKTICEGFGTVECQHGVMNVPVPAVCEIASMYNLPMKFIDNDGEMVTPTGAAIAAALYCDEKLPESFMIKKIGNGAGKRPYKNPVLRIFEID